MIHGLAVTVQAAACLLIPPYRNVLLKKKFAPSDDRIGGGAGSMAV
jgi:hypothetical protein